LPALSRQGKYNDVPYILDISPAQLTVIDESTHKKRKKAYYKTVVADFIEQALHKLSIEE